MNDGGLFDNEPLEDDDFLDGFHDDEEEEIGSDYHVPTELTDTPPDVLPHRAPPSTEHPARKNKLSRHAKVKAMPLSLQRRGVKSMIITYTNGKQVVLVNPNP